MTSPWSSLYAAFVFPLDRHMYGFGGKGGVGSRFRKFQFESSPFFPPVISWTGFQPLVRASGSGR